MQWQTRGNADSIEVLLNDEIVSGGVLSEVGDSVLVSGKSGDRVSVRGLDRLVKRH